MEEVLDHNQEAEQIFRQYGRLLELVAAAQLPGRPEDAEECVQDAVWAFVEARARRRITRRELRCGTDCAGCWRG